MPTTSLRRILEVTSLFVKLGSFSLGGRLGIPARAKRGRGSEPGGDHRSVGPPAVKGGFLAPTRVLHYNAFARPKAMRAALFR